MKDVPAGELYDEIDDFAFDFGYAVGTEIKLFHAVSMVDIGQETEMFPLGWRKSRTQDADPEKGDAAFTAVVEDEFDIPTRTRVTALAFMEDEQHSGRTVAGDERESRKKRG